jgi:predicted Zn-dependent protease
MCNQRFVARNILILVQILVIGGCASNPQMNGRSGSAALSPQTTIRSESNGPADSDILAAFGGEYSDPALHSYINAVAQRVAAGSGNSAASVNVTILDTPIVNAFSAAGGGIYVTRGMLAIINNEDQLAAVIAREIAGPCQQPKSETARAESVGKKKEPAALPEMKLPALDYLHPCNPQGEYEAEVAAVRLTSRTGYDPRAMAALLGSIRDYEALTARTFGRKRDSLDPLGYLALHADATTQYGRALKEAGLSGKADLTQNRYAYLVHVDGMLYGGSAATGFVNGSVYRRPDWGIRFVAPIAFRLFATRNRVYAYGSGNSLIAFEPTDQPVSGSLVDYIGQVWAPGAELRNVRKGHLHRMDAGAALTSATVDGRPMDMRLFVVRVDAAHAFRLYGIMPANDSRYEYAFLKMIATISMLPDKNDAMRFARYVKIIEARPGDTVQRLADRTDINTPRLEFLQALNGLGPADTVFPGMRAKLIVGNGQRVVKNGDGTPTALSVPPQ